MTIAKQVWIKITVRSDTARQWREALAAHRVLVKRKRGKRGYGADGMLALALAVYRDRLKRRYGAAWPELLRRAGIASEPSSPLTRETVPPPTCRKVRRS